MKVLVISQPCVLGYFNAGHHVSLYQVSAYLRGLGHEVLSLDASATLGFTGLYSIFADQYRAVAAELGISPNQLQAVTWIQWRFDHPDDVRGSALREKIKDALVPEGEEQP